MNRLFVLIKSHSYLDTLAVVFFSLILNTTVYLTTPLTEINDGYDRDGLHYARMSQSDMLQSDVEMPHKQRILIPFIVHHIPLPTISAFSLIAFVSCVVNIVVFYLLLLKIGFSRFFSFVGILFYAGVFWSVKFSYFSPCYTDYVSQLILLLLLYLVVDRQHLLAIVLLCLATLHKEVFPYFSIFVVSDYLFKLNFKTNRKEKLILVIYLLSPFVVLKVLHFFGSLHTSGSLMVILYQMARFRLIEFWPVFIHAIISGCGILPILIIFGHKSVVTFLKQHPSLIVYFALSVLALFGGIDKSRLFNYMLPLIVILSIDFINNQKFKVNFTFIFWLSACLLIHFYLGGIFSPIGNTESYLSRFVPEHSGGKYMNYFLTNLLIIVVLSIGTYFYLKRTRVVQAE